MRSRTRFDFWRTGCVLPPQMLLPAARLFAERGGGGERARDLETDLRGFFAATSDPLLVLDAGLRVIAINAAACRYLATTTEVAVQAPALEIRMLARLLAAASLPERQLAEGQPVRTEVSLADAEGQTIQCRIEVLPLAGGRTLVHLDDTTPLLRAHRSLEAAESLHRAVLEAMPETAWSMALPEERLLEVSGAVEQLFGYQPADFRRKPELWDELVHPADRERVRAEFRRGLASHRPFEIHFTGLHRDHRDLPSLVNRVVPVLDPNGWLGRCEGFIQDHSRGRQLEHGLRTAEMQLRNVLDAVASGVLAVADGPGGPQVTLCNRRFAQWLGLDAPLEPGAAVDRLPPAARRLLCGGESAADVARQMCSEDVSDEITELANPHRVLRRYAGPLRDPLGGVVGRLVVLEDATPEWLLQRRLTHAQKMESTARLAGGVSHDFNNLLGAVMGFASLMLDETPAGDPRREPLAQIVEAANQASKLSGVLLAFSRESRYERVPVSLNRVIENAYPMLRSGLDLAVRLKLSLAHELPTLLGDELLFQQMIVNLALEATDQLGGTGTLEISTRQTDVPSPAEGASDSAATRAVVVEVRAERTNDAQAKAAEARPGSHERSGLALATVEEIVRAHGGWLTSSIADGAVRFQVLFPLAGGTVTPLIVPEVATAHGHETILVVDDDPGMRLLARSGLKQRGYDVVLVEDGEQALEVVRAGAPGVDLVLLDLAMPGLPGERVLESLRRMRPELPVVIASGYANVESQSSWTAAGAAAFVAKPYRVQDLAQRIREVLDRVHGRAA